MIVSNKPGYFEVICTYYPEPDFVLVAEATPGLRSPKETIQSHYDAQHGGASALCEDLAEYLGAGGVLGADMAGYSVTVHGIRVGWMHDHEILCAISDASRTHKS